MIDIVKLIGYVEHLSKQGTAGFTTEDEKNSIIYSVQYEILSLLCDNYENNQKVSDALINHVKTATTTSSVGGVVTMPDDYYRALAVLYGSYPATKIGVNELGMVKTSPIRGMSVANNRIGYYFQNGTMVTLPEQALAIKLIYCKKPVTATIAYTEAEDEDDDYLVVDEAGTVDIGFPEGLFNLFAYSVLEKLGIEQKDNLALEYSQLGISRAIKTDIS